jgi:hypothetical protein
MELGLRFSGLNGEAFSIVARMPCCESRFFKPSLIVHNARLEVVVGLSRAVLSQTPACLSADNPL